ncbi:hypothetical protein [Streptomyces sp. NBC_01367]|uniref:hypothetical protein n=1 Tax=Streptomyces sp. NBC_01367 TaxID=2903841 RepID=UPI00324B4F50
MAEADPSDCLSRLENLITDNLHTRIDPANHASMIGWGPSFNVAHQIRAVLTLHHAGACVAASLNRRSALTYAITLRWCVDQVTG